MAEYPDELVILYNIEGIARKSGNTQPDNKGTNWLQFTYDAFADMDDEPGPPACEADDCENLVEEGWVCMDGGDTLCDDHIYFADQVTSADWDVKYILFGAFVEETVYFETQRTAEAAWPVIRKKLARQKGCQQKRIEALEIRPA